MNYLLRNNMEGKKEEEYSASEDEDDINVDDESEIENTVHSDKNEENKKVPLIDKVGTCNFEMY